MKRLPILLAVLLIVAIAPSSFACWNCDTTQGCYGTEVGVGGWTDCEFDGVTCHRIRPFCQGFRNSAPLSAQYKVSAVHVVEANAKPQPAAQPTTQLASQPTQTNVVAR